MCRFRNQNKTTWSLRGFPECPRCPWLLGHTVEALSITSHRDVPDYQVTWQTSLIDRSHSTCLWLLGHSDLHGWPQKINFTNQPAQEGRTGWHMAETKTSDNLQWLIQMLENKKSIHSHLQYFNLKILPKSFGNIICMKAHISKKVFSSHMWFPRPPDFCVSF